VGQGGSREEVQHLEEGDGEGGGEPNRVGNKVENSVEVRRIKTNPRIRLCLRP